MCTIRLNSLLVKYLNYILNTIILFTAYYDIVERYKTGFRGWTEFVLACMLWKVCEFVGSWTLGRIVLCIIPLQEKR